MPSDLREVLAEHALTQEPRRIDAVVVRRVTAKAWRASHLRGVFDDLRDHNLLHVKGATDALERADAMQVLSYAYQCMAALGLRSPAVLALRGVAPTLTPRLREQLTVFGGALVESEVRGVHVGHLQGFALRVVETSVVWTTPGERLLYAISPACLAAHERPRGFDDAARDVYYRFLQGITQLSQDPRWRAIMKDATLVGETASQALMDLLAVIPPEQRLAGLAPRAALARAQRIRPRPRAPRRGPPRAPRGLPGDPPRRRAGTHARAPRPLTLRASCSHVPPQRRGRLRPARGGPFSPRRGPSEMTQVGPAPGLDTLPHPLA